MTTNALHQDDELDELDEPEEDKEEDDEYRLSMATTTRTLAGHILMCSATQSYVQCSPPAARRIIYGTGWCTAVVRKIGVPQTKHERNPRGKS